MKAWLAAAAVVGIGVSISGGYALADDRARPDAWSGAYAGLNIGYGWSGNDVSYSDYFAGAFSSAFGAGQVPRQQSLDPDGLVGGVQAGYNWQRGRLVYGAEVDFSAADIEGSNRYSFPGNPASSPADTVAHQSIDWLATFRARVGVSPLDKWLLYVTGGLALGETKSDFDLHTLPSPPLVTIKGTQDGVRTGFVVGGGVEYALTGSLTTRVEYLHYDLGSDTASGPQVTFGTPESFGLKAKYDFSGDIIRGAINYRF